MKTLKTIIKITYFPMLAWMIYAFFHPDTVSNEAVIGFIVYVFIGAIVAAKDKAIGSVNDMTWDDENPFLHRSYINEDENENSLLYKLNYDPLFRDDPVNIHYVPNNNH